jgi:hypothetical protein
LTARGRRPVQAARTAAGATAHQGSNPLPPRRGPRGRTRAGPLPTAPSNRASRWRPPAPAHLDLRPKIGTRCACQRLQAPVESMPPVERAVSLLSMLTDGRRPPPPLPRTNRTRLVPPPVLTGHAASMLHYADGRAARGRTRPAWWSCRHWRWRRCARAPRGAADSQQPVSFRGRHAAARFVPRRAQHHTHTHTRRVQLVREEGRDASS